MITGLWPTIHMTHLFWPQLHCSRNTSAGFLWKGLGRVVWLQCMSGHGRSGQFFNMSCHSHQIKWLKHLERFQMQSMKEWRSMWLICHLSQNTRSLWLPPRHVSHGPLRKGSGTWDWVSCICFSAQICVFSPGNWLRVEELHCFLTVATCLHNFAVSGFYHACRCWFHCCWPSPAD